MHAHVYTSIYDLKACKYKAKPNSKVKIFLVAVTGGDGG